MEIHCYSCGLELGDSTAEIVTAAHLLDPASREWVRDLLARTSFNDIPPASFCTFCLQAIIGCTDMFDPDHLVRHMRFDVRMTVGTHRSTHDWATCVDCGVTLREPTPQAVSPLPPDVRLRRRMLLHSAVMRYGAGGGGVQALAGALDHRDGV